MDRVQELKEIRKDLTQLLRKVDALIERLEPRIELVKDCPLRKVNRAKCIAKDDFDPLYKCAVECPLWDMMLEVGKFVHG